MPVGRRDEDHVMTASILFNTASFSSAWGAEQRVHRADKLPDPPG
jgi:hypothetical protein